MAWGLVSPDWSFVSCHLLLEHTDHKLQGQASAHQGTGGLQAAGQRGPLRVLIPHRERGCNLLLSVADCDTVTSVWDE